MKSFHCLTLDYSLITAPNCHTNVLGPIYPGQTIRLRLFLNLKVAKEATVPVSVKVYDDDDAPHLIC